MEAGREPIRRDELLYRRISFNSKWYDPATGVVNPQAFVPHKLHDVTGLSIARGIYRTPQEAAQGPSSNGYYVAVLLAADLEDRGILVEPRPDVLGGYDASHAELPQLHSAVYKETSTLELCRLLASLCIRVEGPFSPEADS